MNPIIKFIEDSKAAGLNLDDVSGELEAVIESASVEEVLEAYKPAMATEAGSAMLANIYRNIRVPEDTVLEHMAFADKAYDYLPEGDYYDKHRENINACLENLNTLKSLYSSDEYVAESLIAFFAEEINTIDNAVVMEGAYVEWDEHKAANVAMKKVNAEFGLALVDFALTPDSVMEASGKTLTDYANVVIRRMNQYDILERIKESNLVSLEPASISMQGEVAVFEAGNNEAIQVKKDGKPVGKTSVPVNHKANIRKVKNTVAKGQSATLSTYDKLKRMNKEERVEAVLTGGIRRKLSTLMRTAILSGAVAAVNPALGVLTLVTSVAVRKRSDQRLKQEILQEYEGELKLVREKIRDAESAGDRKKKYQLMRIENNLQQNIDRIKSPVRMNKPAPVRKG